MKTETPATPAKKNYLVGIFEVDSVSQTVEVPLTGDSGLDFRALSAEVRKRYPKAKQIVRVGSTIESRTAGEPVFIPISTGTTLRELFNANEDEVTREIGTVFFQGKPCSIALRFLRSKSVVTVAIREKATGVSIAFSNQISVMRLAHELPVILAGVFGATEHRELKLITKLTS